MRLKRMMDTHTQKTVMEYTEKCHIHTTPMEQYFYFMNLYRNLSDFRVVDRLLLMFEHIEYISINIHSTCSHCT